MQSKNTVRFKLWEKVYCAFCRTIGFYREWRLLNSSNLACPNCEIVSTPQKFESDITVIIPIAVI